MGFPGETEAQFEETLSLVAEADFDDAYTFKYSVRDGTPAVRLKDHVPDEVASERLDRLIEAVREQARRKNVARVGTDPRGSGRAAGPAGRSHAGPHPHATIWSCWISRPTAIGEYHPSVLPAPPAPPSRARSSRPQLAVL